MKKVILTLPRRTVKPMLGMTAREKELKQMYPTLPVGRRYYDYDGQPAYSTGFLGDGYIVHPNTKVKINLVDLREKGCPVDREEFDRMVARAKTRANC